MSLIMAASDTTPEKLPYNTTLHLLFSSKNGKTMKGASLRLGKSPSYMSNHINYGQPPKLDYEDYVKLADYLEEDLITVAPHLAKINAGNYTPPSNAYYGAADSGAVEYDDGRVIPVMINQKKCRLISPDKPWTQEMLSALKTFIDTQFNQYPKE